MISLSFTRDFLIIHLAHEKRFEESSIHDRREIMKCKFFAGWKHSLAVILKQLGHTFEKRHRNALFLSQKS